MVLNSGRCRFLRWPVAIFCSFAATSTALAQLQSAEDIARQKAALLAEITPVLVGPWGRLSDRNGKMLTENPFEAGDANCKQTPRLRNPRFAKGTVEELPPNALRSGSIIYYQVKDGFQRLDLENGAIIPIRNVERGQPRRGHPVWILVNEQGKLRVAFGEARDKGRVAPIMIEERQIFMKCPIYRSGEFKNVPANPVENNGFRRSPDPQTENQTGN